MLLDQCLEIAPDWRQALSLKKAIKDRVTKEVEFAAPKFENSPISRKQRTLKGNEQRNTTMDGYNGVAFGIPKFENESISRKPRTLKGRKKPNNMEEYKGKQRSLMGREIYGNTPWWVDVVAYVAPRYRYKTVKEIDGIGYDIPQLLYELIEEAAAARYQFRKHGDKLSIDNLIVAEASILDVARYFKEVKKLPPNWE